MVPYILRLVWLKNELVDPRLPVSPKRDKPMGASESLMAHKYCLWCKSECESHVFSVDVKNTYPSTVKTGIDPYQQGRPVVGRHPLLWVFPLLRYSFLLTHFLSLSVVPWQPYWGNLTNNPAWSPCAAPLLSVWWLPIVLSRSLTTLTVTRYVNRQVAFSFSGALLRVLWCSSKATIVRFTTFLLLQWTVKLKMHVLFLCVFVCVPFGCENNTWTNLLNMNLSVACLWCLWCSECSHGFCLPDVGYWCSVRWQWELQWKLLPLTATHVPKYCTRWHLWGTVTFTLSTESLCCAVLSASLPSSSHYAAPSAGLHFVTVTGSQPESRQFGWWITWRLTCWLSSFFSLSMAQTSDVHVRACEVLGVWNVNKSYLDSFDCFSDNQNLEHVTNMG